MATNTLQENIQQAVSDFDGIKTALESKGVSVPEGTKTSAYGALISSISGGDEVQAICTYDTKDAAEGDKVLLNKPLTKAGALMNPADKNFPSCSYFGAFLYDEETSFVYYTGTTSSSSTSSNKIWYYYLNDEGILSYAGEVTLPFSVPADYGWQFLGEPEAILMPDSSSTLILLKNTATKVYDTCITVPYRVYAASRSSNVLYTSGGLFAVTGVSDGALNLTAYTNGGTTALNNLTDGNFISDDGKWLFAYNTYKLDGTEKTYSYTEGQSSLCRQLVASDRLIATYNSSVNASYQFSLYEFNQETGKRGALLQTLGEDDDGYYLKGVQNGLAVCNIYGSSIEYDGLACYYDAVQDKLVSVPVKDNSLCVCGCVAQTEPVFFIGWDILKYTGTDVVSLCPIESPVGISRGSIVAMDEDGYLYTRDSIYRCLDGKNFTLVGEGMTQNFSDNMSWGVSGSIYNASYILWQGKYQEAETELNYTSGVADSRYAQVHMILGYNSSSYRHIHLYGQNPENPFERKRLTSTGDNTASLFKVYRTFGFPGKVVTFTDTAVYEGVADYEEGTCVWTDVTATKPISVTMWPSQTGTSNSIGTTVTGDGRYGIAYNLNTSDEGGKGFFVLEDTGNGYTQVTTPDVLNSLKDEEIKSLRCVSDKTIMVVARDGVYEFVYTNSIADLQLVNSWKGMYVYGTSGYSPAKKFFWLSRYSGNVYNYGGEIFSFQESSYAWIAEKYRGDNFYSGTLTGIVSQDAEGGEVTVKTVRPDLLSGTLTISEDNATVILKGDEQ